MTRDSSTDEGSPLHWSATVSPKRSPVDADLELRVTLANASSRPISVNRRLLLNTRSTPEGYGEVFVDVDGPPTYRNRRRVTIRTARASVTDFGRLEPGESVERTYMLTEYESFHEPGEYCIEVTYRNAVEGPADGIPSFTGSLRPAVVTFERYAPE